MTISTPNFEWYQIVEGNTLEQGDFLNDFPILIQPDTMPVSREELEKRLPNLTIEAKGISVYNVVILTQSCDFNKIQDEDLVVLCARYDYKMHFGKDRWKPLIEGRIVHNHLLNKCEIEGHQFDYQVVDLGKIFSIPYGYVKKAAQGQGKRVRLLPPYREHLSQAFARRFMRVGLPLDLPREYPYKE